MCLLKIIVFMFFFQKNIICHYIHMFLCFKKFILLSLIEFCLCFFFTIWQQRLELLSPIRVAMWQSTLSTTLTPIKFEKKNQKMFENFEFFLDIFSQHTCLVLIVKEKCFDWLGNWTRASANDNDPFGYIIIDKKNKNFKI